MEVQAEVEWPKGLKDSCEKGLLRGLSALLRETNTPVTCLKQ